MLDNSAAIFRFKINPDRVWILVFSTLILTLGSLPTWIGRASETSELSFRGIYFDSQDYAVHISTMQAGRNGEWSYQLRFTTEPHRPAFIKMFYILLGHLSTWTRLTPGTTYHLSRWIFGYLALFSIYSLCQRILPQRVHARYAFLMASIGSGLGWLQLMFRIPFKPFSPVDFWLVDLYVFFSLSIFPHFAFLLALTAISLRLYLDYLRVPQPSDGTNLALRSPFPKGILLIGVMSITAQLVNPIAFAGIDAAILGATFFRWWQDHKIVRSHVFSLIFLALVQIPLLLYNYFTLLHDPLWSQFTLQNQTPSPPFAYLFWGLALFWPFAIAGVWNAFRTKSPGTGSLTAWVLSGFILAYLPLGIQRRFLSGLTIPLGLLSVVGVVYVLRLANKNLILFSYILLAGISSIYLSLGSSLFMRTHPNAYYYPAELGNALMWLDQNASPDEFVLASAQTGSITAQYTRLKVFIGHEMETVNFGNKNSQVKDFYRGNSPPGWLATTGTKWVIYGPYEHTLSNHFLPEADLNLVFDQTGVQIYEIRSP